MPPPQKIDLVAEALHPVKVVVWGELAMGFHGAGISLYSYMMIPSESDFDLAEQKLIDAGFRPTSLTYGLFDPSRIRDEETRKRRIDPNNSDYRMLDQNSKRFRFPAGIEDPETVMLLKSTYIGLSPPNDAVSAQRFQCDKHENLHYPDKSLLLESIVRTCLQQGFDDHWSILLECWAISYIYGLLMVDDGVLDSCDDESIKSWFNEKIRRGKGGIDRKTVTKRRGKRQKLPGPGE